MDQVRDELMIVWGLWLDDVEHDRDRVVSSAVAALVAGLDSPGLRELAGLPPDASWDEVDRLVRQTAVELGLPEPSDDLALRTELLCLARQVLAGDIAERTFTSWAHTRIGYDGPAELQALVELDDDLHLLDMTYSDAMGLWDDRTGPADAPAADRADLDSTVRSIAAALVDGETDLTRFVPARGSSVSSQTPRRN
ncbi:MAG: hypothetical protein FWH11_14405 [Micrococcales bacterium]|nr:hypothetical protein [Micrococcales bacterium]